MLRQDMTCLISTQGPEGMHKPYPQLQLWIARQPLFDLWHTMSISPTWLWFHSSACLWRFAAGPAFPQTPAGGIQMRYFIAQLSHCTPWPSHTPDSVVIDQF